MKLTHLRSSLATAVFIVSVGVFAAQGQPGSPVLVVNKTANPVPVAGEVNIGTLPAVDSKQSGTWNVGISGTPTVRLDASANTVRIDPNANTVKMERRENTQRVQTATWTGQGDSAITTNGTDVFSKMKVCVAHAAPNPIQVDVFSLVADSFDGPSAFFTYDAFIIGTPSTACRTYDLPGVSVQLKISNTGNKTSGLTRYAIVFGN